MNYHTYFDRKGRTVECCIVGTGGFGRSFLAQGLVVPGLSVRVAVDVSGDVAAESLRSVGIAPDRIRICHDAEAAARAWTDGAFIAAGTCDIVMDLPVDVVVEATGDPVVGARHARLAIEAGHHVAMVSKEVDSVVGPGLAAMARDAGVIVTPVDGDQPSLLIGLITWAQVLGLEIVAAGKSSEYDMIHDPDAGTITCDGVSYDVPDFAGLEVLGEADCADMVARRTRAAAALPQRAVPDLCEMTVVANACEMLPDRPDLHCPIARIDEVPSILCEVGDGGILSRGGVLDVFHCLRRPDEISFAGGVFVVVRCKDAETWEMLRAKGHVLSRNGRTAMIYLPRHLLGMEAATSIFEVALNGVSSGAQVPHHHADLIAVADRDFDAGAHLAMGGHHHSIDGVSSRIVPAGPLDDDSAAPFYLASNCRLRAAVKAGQPIRMRDLHIDQDSPLVALRALQDRRFAVKDEDAVNPREERHA
ncbi:NAD(P)H-dependent oxidoreductase [Oceaniglobus indicus]|uniref:NAD(P)H-dependent oxidoreductase n=1 Tax=Oceaniglobus indicus TaxID=2047749 RepID=UPI000C19A0D3|nr:flagellar biosynthesis protein FlgA [Oceaniglobus indicus]